MAITINEAAIAFVQAIGREPADILDIMVNGDPPGLIRVRFRDGSEPSIIRIGEQTEH